MSCKQKHKKDYKTVQNTLYNVHAPAPLKY